MLTDIDKNSNNRAQPAPNHHDVVNPDTITAKGTNSVNYITNATNQSLIQGAKNGQFSIVKTGVVNYPQQFSTTDPGAGNFGVDDLVLATIPHGLPYIPGVIVYFSTNPLTGFFPLPYYDYTGFFGIVRWVNYEASVDATNLYINAHYMSFGSSSQVISGANFPNFKYYLLQQTSN